MRTRADQGLHRGADRNGTNPYGSCWDDDEDREDDPSLRPHRNPQAAGLLGYGGAVASSGWLSREHRDSALMAAARARVAGRA